MCTQSIVQYTYIHETQHIYDILCMYTIYAYHIITYVICTIIYKTCNMYININGYVA